MKSPLLSVCLITYNQAEFITQAVEGVLMQQTNFSWELVIADDCSTDKTQGILLKFQKEHPHLIKLILQEKNVGAFDNWMDLITYPESKYIAYLDGDDYWTDPSKLQRQIDFLEANPDFSICFHPVNAMVNNVIKPEPDNSTEGKTVYTINDLASEGNFIASSSVVYRNVLPRTFPDWFRVSPVGDYVMHIFNAAGGKIKRLSQNMAIYRRHSGGSWSTLDRLVVLEKWIVTLRHLVDFGFDESVSEKLIQRKRGFMYDYLDVTLHEQPRAFEIKLKTLLKDNPDDHDWLIGKIAQEYLSLTNSNRNYKHLQNSRVRKYLSHIFPQLRQ